MLVDFRNRVSSECCSYMIGLPVCLQHCKWWKRSVLSALTPGVVVCIVATMLAGLTLNIISLYELSSLSYRSLIGILEQFIKTAIPHLSILGESLASC